MAYDEMHRFYLYDTLCAATALLGLWSLMKGDYYSGAFGFAACTGLLIVRNSALKEDSGHHHH